VPGPSRSEFGKQLGKGLFEFRLRHDEKEILNRVRPDLAEKIEAATGDDKILLRVFCYAYGDKIILLIAGYDKAADDSKRRQDREIKAGKKELARFRSLHPETASWQKRGPRGVLLEGSFITYWKSRKKRYGSRELHPGHAREIAPSTRPGARGRHPERRTSRGLTPSCS